MKGRQKNSALHVLTDTSALFPKTHGKTAVFVQLLYHSDIFCQAIFFYRVSVEQFQILPLYIDNSKAGIERPALGTARHRLAD